MLDPAKVMATKSACEEAIKIVDEVYPKLCNMKKDKDVWTHRTVLYKQILNLLNEQTEGNHNDIEKVREEMQQIKDRFNMLIDELEEIKEQLEDDKPKKKRVARKKSGLAEFS